jgi:hypothetical protein
MNNEQISPEQVFQLLLNYPVKEQRMFLTEVESMLGTYHTEQTKLAETKLAKAEEDLKVFRTIPPEKGSNAFPICPNCQEISCECRPKY